MHHCISAVVVLTYALSAGLAHADVETDLLSCSIEQDGESRLRCFDDVARRIGGPDRNVPTVTAGNWTISETLNPLDDTQTVVLSVRSSSGNSTYGQPVALILRCAANQTEVYISWNDYLGSDAEVTWRVGDGSAQTAEWSLSTDSTATFYPRPDMAFIKELMLVERVIPYNSDPVTAVFDVSGLVEVVEPLARACEWPQ